MFLKLFHHLVLVYQYRIQHHILRLLNFETDSVFLDIDYMEDLKKIEESVIKSLEEKKLIGSNKTHDVKEITNSYELIKPKLKEIFDNKPVYKFILKTPQVEVSKSKTALELPNKYLLKNNMKKIINSNLLNHSTTFAEREIIRK